MNGGRLKIFRRDIATYKTSLFEKINCCFSLRDSKQVIHLSLTHAFADKFTILREFF